MGEVSSTVGGSPAQGDAVATATAPRTAAPRRRHWRRRFLAAGVLAALLALFHAPLLRWLAGGLIVEDAPEPADAVILLGESGPFSPVPFDEAAALYRDGFASAVVLIEDRTDRVVRLGIVPPLESFVRRELAARGVPAEAFTAVAASAPTEWGQARGLQSWLREHPQARVTVLAEQLGSRRTAHAFGRVLGPQDAARVRFRAVPDSRFDPTNWWRGRQGISRLASEYIALAFVVLNGETPQTRPEWDPDQYEQSLRPSR